jgi:hypothetical protein
MHDVQFRLLHTSRCIGQELRRSASHTMVLGHERIRFLPTGYLLSDNVRALTFDYIIGVLLCLCSFYRRGELARRLALFYAAQSIASAFGGLLAFGVFQIKNTGLQDWRYLFIIEGSCTVCFSIFAFWYLPHSSSDAKFLNEDEKRLAFYRMQIDSSSIVNEKMNLKESFKILRHPTSWIILCIEICLGVPLQSVSLFLPQIVSRLGFSTVKTNLYTVAPNVSGAVMLLVLAFASDYTRWRFPFIAAGFLFTFIGFIIYVAIDVTHDIHVAYFACFMMTW